ncbi:MAG TPA: hypothetical protein VK996_13410 [Ramlibacter sp.]|nr:hypothetical protein [Ramlibacter sp.]
MKHESHHGAHHWITVALVLAALLLTLNEAHGQSTGSAAMFEGRPAMAGAQGGLGAQAGLPQGGIGVQGSDAAERAIRRKPIGLEEFPQGKRDVDVVAAANTDVLAGIGEKEIARNKDTSIAKEERSAVKKTKRGVKQVVKRAKHGVSDIETARVESGHVKQ